MSPDEWIPGETFLRRDGSGDIIYLLLGKVGQKCVIARSSFVCCELEDRLTHIAPHRVPEFVQSNLKGIAVLYSVGVLGVQLRDDPEWKKALYLDIHNIFQQLGL